VSKKYPVFYHFFQGFESKYTHQKGIFWSTLAVCSPPPPGMNLAKNRDFSKPACGGACRGPGRSRQISAGYLCGQKSVETLAPLIFDLRGAGNGDLRDAAIVSTHWLR
jgi:hypothetical protein